MRVLHVVDIASVGSTLVEHAKTRGEDWDLHELPLASGKLSKVTSRALDLYTFWKKSRNYDLIHVHYGLFSYFGLIAGKPWILHLHGSDVHKNLTNPLTAPYVKHCLQKATRVVYSTPDLRDAVTPMRPDATWLPAPINLEAFHEERPTSQNLTIFFASRWDPIKGLETHLELVKLLRKQHPEIDLVGIDWGEGADRAKALGVTLQPKCSEQSFVSMLSGADFIIGQVKSGALGKSDLQAIASGTPTMASLSHVDAYAMTSGEEGVPFINCSESDATHKVEALIRQSAILQTPAQRAAWVKEFHGLEVVYNRLKSIYQDAKEEKKS